MRKVNNESKWSTTSFTTQPDHQECDSSSQNDNQYTIVADRKKSKTFYLQRKLTSEEKILIEELIQINDLIPQLRNREILTNTHYFGKYGEIATANVTMRQLQTIPKKINYMAFITYKNDIDAAIAIVALSKFTQNCHKFYCKYGTSKYCRNFLSNKDCPYKLCVFQHKVRVNTFPFEKGPLTQKQCVKLAQTKIVANLAYMVEKQYKQFKQSIKKIGQTGKVQCCCEISENESKNFLQFPSIKKILKKLIKQAVIQESTYLEIKNAYERKINKNKKSNFSLPETPLKLIRKIYSEIPSQVVDQPILVKKKTFQDSKISQEERNSPQNIKVNLSAQVKKLQLRLQNQAIYTFCEQPQGEFAVIPKKVQMNQQCFNSMQAFNNYVYSKILNKIDDKRKSKSFFKFTNQQTKEQMSQVSTEQISVTIQI